MNRITVDFRRNIPGSSDTFLFSREFASQARAEHFVNSRGWAYDPSTDTPVTYAIIVN